MTPSRTSHRSRSLALSTLNRIRSTTFDCTGTSQRMQQKKYGRLIPGRGNLGAVKIALTIAGGNVWLVGGSRSALGSGVQGKEEVKEVEDSETSLSLALAQAIEEMNSPLVPLSTLAPITHEEAGTLSDVEEEFTGELGDEEEDWEVLSGEEVVEEEKGKDVPARRLGWVKRLY